MTISEDCERLLRPEPWSLQPKLNWKVNLDVDTRRAQMLLKKYLASGHLTFAFFIVSFYISPMSVIVVKI